MNDPTHCPKCNTDLRGEDIYEYWLKEYTKGGMPGYSLEHILEAIKDYPDLYKNAPSEEKLRGMTLIELNAWYSANSYGWSEESPKTFKKELGIEIRGYYDGVALWRCPECKHVWKRGDWIEDRILKEYLDGEK